MRLFSAVCILFVSVIAVCIARTLRGADDDAWGNQMKHHFWKACYDKTGSNRTFRTISSYLTAMPACFMAHVDVQSFEKDINSWNNLSRHIFFPKYCPQMRDALECIELPLREYRKCVHDDDAHLARIVSHTLPETLDLICENNGEILFAKDVDYVACIDSFGQYIEECGDMTGTSNRYNGTVEMPSSSYGEDQCAAVIGFRQCMMQKTKLCKGPLLVNVFHETYTAFIKASTCRKFIVLPDDEKQKTTPSSFTNLNQIQL